MSPKRRGSAASVLLFLAAFIFIASAGRINAGCTCFDCENMLNRYNQINCLLGEVCKERSDMRASGKASQKFDFGDYNANYLKKWSNAMAACKSPKATLFPSGNTDGFCGSTVSNYGDSNCMQGSVRAHEDKHVQTCKDTFKTKSDCTHSNWPVILQTGYADCLTWDEYYTDDIAAYNVELSYLKGWIDKWRDNCKALNLWCRTNDTGLEPSKCTSAITPKNLFAKLVNYFSGR